ncbi:MAG: Hpt domain-containing protein [Pyrinomonadaceae bacterium]
MKVSERAVSPVNFERLREVSDSDPLMINEIIELYFSQTRQQLNELEKAIGAQDFDSIYKLAHRIAGGSLTCGMNAVVEPIRALEQAGRSQKSENAEQLFAGARQAFEQMEKYLRANRKQLFG